MFDIYKIIDFICEGHTINEACSYFGCSRSFIMKELKKIRTPNTAEYNEILAEKINLALARNSLAGRKNGGSISKKNQVISDEEALTLRTLKESQGLSYRDLEQITGISYSTIRLAIDRTKSEFEDETSRGR